MKPKNLLCIFQIIIVHFQLYFMDFSKALNCKSFSPDEAKFAVENFHRIHLFGNGGRNDGKVGQNAEENGRNGQTNKKESSSKIVENFMESLRAKLSSRNKSIEFDQRVIENNGRKMITMATDICNRLPTEGKNYSAGHINLSAGYIHCVQFLLYHHLQKLVWRLEHKFGVNFGPNDLQSQTNENGQNLAPKNSNRFLEIYTDKKMVAWGKMVTIYGSELKDLTEINEKIRRKFDFCLVIEGETQLKCNAISIENAQLFVKYFQRIVFEPEFESKRSKKAELIGTNIFNSLRTEQRKDEQQKQEQNEEDKIMAKNWKLAEPSMRVRVQVLVNTAERKCRKMAKNPFRNFAKFGRSLSKKLDRSWSLRGKGEREERKKDDESAKNGEEMPTDGTTTENANALDELSSSFVICIYHYMYAFSENLITKIEEKSVENDKKLKEIYKKLRGKTRKRMELLFKIEGLNEMDKWLNGEKQTASSSSIDEIEIENDEAEEEEEEDPFHNCANVVEDQVEEDNTVQRGYGGLMDKSFDDFLFECAGQFIAAVAEDQFDYKLFVNLYTMQLDTTMEFPWSMKDNGKMPTKNGQNAKDKCQMMRELLISLNKNLAHRLNFEQITSRKEKERWTSLHQKLENLRLEKVDNRWLSRTGKKLSQSYQNFVRDFRKWKAKGTLYHPIRDEFRRARQGVIRGQQQAKKLIRSMSMPRSRRLKRTNDDKSRKMIRQLMLENKQQMARRLEQQRGGREDKIFEITCAHDDVSISSSSSEQQTKKLEELFAEENFETPEIVMGKIDQKMEKIWQKIAEEPLGKRLKDYTMFYHAFYIALALELFERMYGKEGAMATNWHFVLRSSDGAVPEPSAKQSFEKDKFNAEIVKKSAHIFDEILKKMGKTLAKQKKTINWKFWDKSKKPTTTEENGGKSIGEEGGEGDKAEGVGYELRYLGYTTEKNGQQLLETLQDEMKLNLDQFNMSFDGQCDLTSDLNDCFVASDGIDFDAQVEKVSLFGKEIGEMVALERATESLFKKLNRWSFKFGQKGKRNRNLLARYFNGKIKAILAVIPEMMTERVSPFELVIPFYLPMKNLVKFTFKKILVKPKEWFSAWLLNLFSTTNFFMNDGDELLKQKKKGKAQIERVEMSEIEPTINVSNVDESLSDNLDKIIKQMTKIAMKKEQKEKENKTKKEKKKSDLGNLFKKVAKMLKDMFTNFGLKMAQNEIEKNVGENGQQQNNGANTKMVTRKRRKRSGIGAGAGITAYIEAGREGSSTVGALLIDAKVVDWGLTTPLPGLHLHWLHIGHPIMLGKYNIAMSLTTGIIVIFIIVGMLYWWHALKLAVYLAIQYGDTIGWVIIFVAAVFYIIFCVGFVMV